MAVETELKLRIAPEQLSRLRRHVLLRQCQTTRPVTQRLYNIYFDTEKFDLYKSAMALRLRRVGGNWLQTLKGGGSVNAGLHQRNEWEVPVSRAVLDFSSPQLAECIQYLPPIKKLQPVFITDFSRTSRIVVWQGAQIELSMDHGKVLHEDRSYPISEVELELKSGEPAQLFDLALALLEIVPFELEQVSKAEQGYRLLRGYTELPVKGVTPALTGNSTTSEALKALIWSCMQHLQANLHGMMTGDNAEYLHQMRVALRRLRVVLRMTKKFRADDTLSALFQDVSALCVALGRVREWDVFIAHTLQPMTAQMAENVGLSALVTVSQQKRAAYYAELRSTNQARNLQKLILHLALWMNGEYWQQDEKVISLQEFSDHHLNILTKRYFNSAQQIEIMDDKQLHGLRILTKKLRYSAEFFSALYDKDHTKRYIAALSEVQEVLGQLNDVTVSRHLLAELAMAPELASHREAVSLVNGWVEHSRIGQFAALESAFCHFGKQKKFWSN